MATYMYAKAARAVVWQYTKHSFVGRQVTLMAFCAVDKGGGMWPRLMQLQQGGRPLPSSIRQIGSAPRDPMQKQKKATFQG
jgi:hypothetical protein